MCCVSTSKTSQSTSVYLDPPFNSSATYNVLFKEGNGIVSEAQAEAFKDTWAWGHSAAEAYEDALRLGGDLAILMRAFRAWLGDNGLMAYLAMMSVRLVELHRALKPSGSLYLHCDPTASHYLKLVLDAVFGPQNFRNDITWKRRVGMSSAVHSANRFGTITDTILFCAKSEKTGFHVQYNKDDPDYQRYINERFTMVDPDGRRFYAVTLIETRLRKAHPDADYKIYGRPTDLAGARDLADRDKYQFQWWGRLEARRSNL
jgi:site-specific DNA-methyltransferase (adenine-specific)